MSIGQGLVMIGPGEGRLIDIGGLGVQFKFPGSATGGSMSIVEHPMEAGRLVPPHVHRDEDELSYGLEGAFGVRIGDEVAEVSPGSYIFKPRNVPHTFWNAGPGPAGLIEIIQPAGFEDFFQKLGEVAEEAKSPEEFDAARTALGSRYNLAFVPEWIEELKKRSLALSLGLLGASRAGEATDHRGRSVPAASSIRTTS